MLAQCIDYDPEDDEPWADNYQYLLLKKSMLEEEVKRGGVPLDDNHICPMCNGKGFIKIVKGR